MRASEVRSATARPVALNPVITPSTKKAHTTSPPVRALHPVTALSLLRLATAATSATADQSKILASPIANQLDFRLKPDAAFLLDLDSRHLDQFADLGRIR